MKNLLFYLSLIALASSCIHKEGEKSEKLFMCNCEQNILLNDSSEVQAKDSYIFLVYSEGTPDCCSNKLATEFKGYHEKWQNADSHPKVWKRITTPYEELDASTAMTNGCNIEDKVIAIYDLTNASHKVKEYYPELIK